MSPFFCPIIVNRNDITAENYAKLIQKKGVTLLAKYGCIISEWNFAKKYLDKKFKTHNSINFRNKTFNLFLNEKYDHRIAIKFAKIIKQTDKEINSV